jgi:hypothetical protein
VRAIVIRSSQRSEDVEIEQPKQEDPFIRPSFSLKDLIENPKKSSEIEQTKQEGPFVVASFRCNDSVETSNIEANPLIDDDAAKLFVQDAVRATKEWADYVLGHWLDSEERQPGEFLGIEGWAEGPNLALKAVPSYAPGSRLEFEPSFQIQTVPVRNGDQPCGVA